MRLSDREIDMIKKYYKTDDVGVLVWQVYLDNQSQPGLGDRLLDAVVAVLAGDSLMAERSQAEAGQASVVPKWFYNACNLLQARKQTPDTVIPYLKTELAKVSEIAEQNKRLFAEELAKVEIAERNKRRFAED
ncbi:MAG: hypothetical protein ACP5RH_13830 [Leptodesmis sp.]|uniref:hypothetical protein n=1 Tax=Leptodesmis sp. TaxID=3100501 RepID=UPI003D09D54C